VVAVGDKGLIVRSDDSGRTWSEVKSGVNGQLASVSGTRDGRELWVSGADGLLLYSLDLGLTWKRIFVPSNRGLRAVHLTHTLEVIVAGWRENILIGSKLSDFNLVRGAPYKADGVLYTHSLGLLAFGQG